MSALKLGFLLIRTIAKPIANSIKSYSKTHPKFREACIGVAQFSHRTEMQLKMKFLGYKVEAIRPLNDARSRKSAKDRRNYVDDTLDNLLIITEELREEVKDISQSSEQKIAQLQHENMQLKRTLNEILDVSLRLRSHTAYSGEDIGLGNTTGGFFLEIQGPPKEEESTFVPPSGQKHTPQSPQPQSSSSRQSSPKSTSKFDGYHHDISESFKHHRDAYERPSDQDYIVVNLSSTHDQHEDHHNNNSHHQQSLEKKTSVFSLPSSWSLPSFSRLGSSSASDASSSSSRSDSRSSDS
ncbi:hypothetical protein BGZ73_000030 [Actinomortierella ambigua]|nr:hypothetical protein BGZ73_000030 [Actinomortierella ambigua]